MRLAAAAWDDDEQRWAAARADVADFLAKPDAAHAQSYYGRHLTRLGDIPDTATTMDLIESLPFI